MLVNKTNPVLREISTELDLEYMAFHADGFEETISLMRDLIKEKKALGLAANQIGSNKRFFVIKPGTFFYTCVNPTFEPLLEFGTSIMEEGCLSLPGEKVKVTRYSKIKVKYYDWDRQKEISSDVGGLFARVYQHEVDHLNGVLINDYA